MVLGYRQDVGSDRALFDGGTPVSIVQSPDTFYEKLKDWRPDIIAVHLVSHVLLPFLIRLKKPMVFFLHGYEVLSWRRRMMNYTKPGDFPYLVKFFLENNKQRKEMRRLVKFGERRDDISFVFVSNWLRNAAEVDLRTRFTNCRVIPNGVDLDVFSKRTKVETLRTKILVIRSFRARNYANDITIDAILMLSKQPIFPRLEFTIYGEGYLFKELTDKVKHFSNVTLNNFFVPNTGLPAIHERFGIFLAPSRLDTQGVSTCEAMASGLVPITSAVGGIPEFTTDGIDCFHVSTADQMAERIEFLQNNPEVFLRMSMNARQAMEGKCDLTKTTEEELALFENIVTK
jgi:glycosyltransferase involved in cell wall biosynthesis